MTDLNERLAQEAAELINGGEWRDGKWYSDGQRDAWRRALKPAADRIEKLEAALCNVTTAWDLWQKTNDSNSFTELFACICEAKALEEKKPLEWTENYGQGSEPWLKEDEK